MGCVLLQKLNGADRVVFCCERFGAKYDFVCPQQAEREKPGWIFNNLECQLRFNMHVSGLLLLLFVESRNRFGTWHGDGKMFAFIGVYQRRDNIELIALWCPRRRTPEL